MSGPRQALVRTRLLGREAVATIATVTAALLAALPLLGWSTDRVGLASAALVSLGGVLSAWLVSVDRALPLLMGFGKAVIAVVASFGLHLPDNWVSALMALLTFIGALAVTRPQVGAEQPPRDREGNISDAWPRPLIVSPTTEFFDEQPIPRDAPPLPTPPDQPQRGDHTMPWSTREPSTEYLPRTGQSQMQQRRPGEGTGRHHAADGPWNGGWVTDFG